MSFTDGKRFIVTKEEHLSFNWGFGKGTQNFRCYLCGYKFKEGDGVRWQYTGGVSFINPKNNKKYGVINFLVCDCCDTPNVIEKWLDIHRDYYSDKFWTFREK